MDDTLSDRIAHYIAGLRDRKLEAFDKDTVKALKQATDSDSAAIEAERQQARSARAAEFAPRVWLARAAERANQIALTTHAIKFSHTDAKGSNLNAQVEQPDHTTVGTHSLTSPDMDVAGNAAAMDVANLLLLKDNHLTLWQALEQNDLTALQPFAQDAAELAQWATAFTHPIQSNQFQTHSLAKQLYWPVDGEYHLIAPLFASSLTHSVWSAVQAHRFDESAKTARTQRRAEKGCADDVTYLGNLASMSFGGSKPLNISLQNSWRQGKAYMLPSAPPHWQDSLSPPTTSAALWRQVTRATRAEVNDLRRFLAGTVGRTNQALRQHRADGVADITTRFFLLVHSLREQQPAGWTRNTQLSTAEQCLLDPDRLDEPGTHTEFKRAIDTKSWREDIAVMFARWLNPRLSRLRSSDGDKTRMLGDAEANEWQELIATAISYARDDIQVLLDSEIHNREQGI